MATYNGAAFLSEQLASLARQTRLPDELIISDDHSTDTTVAIAKAFAETSPFPVNIIVNEANLGYAKNFAAAARHFTGDLVFLADQDDIWCDDKIATIVDLANDSAASVFSHDISIFSTDPAKPNRPSYYRHLETEHLSPAVCLKGCTLAIRSAFIAKWGWPPEKSDISHDFWVTILSTGLRQRQYIDKILVHHRIHGGNASGWVATRKDFVRLPLDSAAQLEPVSDLDLLIELCIKRWNLWRTDAFLGALRRHGHDLDPGLVADFVDRLEKNRAWYRHNDPERRLSLPRRIWRKLRQA
jgi:glycosyltransferase involved in cell wall biosynthesis